MTTQQEINKFIYLPIYLSDYVSQSRKLTMLQRGAFIDLSVLYFQENLKLQYTKEQIYRFVFAFEKEEREAVDFILDNYFIKSENKPTGFYWFSNELNEAGNKVLKRLNASRKNGKLGGRGNKKENKPMGSNLLNLEKSILNEIKLNEIKLNENNYSNLDNEVTNKKNKSKKDFDLPDFIDAILFDDFLDMRKKIKKPVTEKAKELIIKKLTEFENKKSGEANISLENSIANCWQGVFEPKTNNQSYQNNYITKEERTRIELQEFLKEQEKLDQQNIIIINGDKND